MLAHIQETEELVSYKSIPADWNNPIYKNETSSLLSNLRHVDINENSNSSQGIPSNNSKIDDSINITNNYSTLSAGTSCRAQSISTPPLEQLKPRVIKGVRFEGIQDTLPRSQSYTSRSSRSRRRISRKKYLSDNRLENKASSCHRPVSNSKSAHQTQCSRKNLDEHESDDASSVCSTCSSTSSSSDDNLYQLPQRRHYGGVRVSYVPNDAFACARQRRQHFEMEKDNKNCILS